ncbi:hypothetical protein ACIBJE_02005 [Micromonospora sp. NPDC050187]|uniref:hypothetical protein n=1 Tax=Micromonospora sp. NPDC050187 TaxID=3364277 RepID=UPI00379DE0FF
MWSYLLSTAGITGLLVAARHPRAGWTINIVAQALWLAYAVISRQYGFLLAAAAYTVAYVRLLRRARVAHPTPTVDTGRYRAPVTRSLPATIAALVLTVSLAACGGDETGQPTAAASSSAPAATSAAPRNEVECVNINRAHNAWERPSLLRTADEIAAMNEGAVRLAMEDGKNYLNAVTGYDDQPSKELASAIAQYNVEISFVNLQVVMGDGVDQEQAEKTAAAVAKVMNSYQAWKTATCG